MSRYLQALWKVLKTREGIAFCLDLLVLAILARLVVSFLSL